MKSALLTVREVSKRLGLAETATYALLKSGQLPVVKLGTGPRARLRVEADDLERWIKAQKTQTHARSARLSKLTPEEERDALGIERNHVFVN